MQIYLQTHQGGVSYCLASGQRDFNSSGQTRVETPSVKRPKLSSNICGQAHSTHECGYNPDQKATLNVDVDIVNLSIREIIQTGIVKVVRIMMVKLRVYLRVYNRTIMRPNIRPTFAKLRMHSRVNTEPKLRGFILLRTLLVVGHIKLS